MKNVISEKNSTVSFNRRLSVAEKLKIIKSNNFKNIEN